MTTSPTRQEDNRSLMHQDKLYSLNTLGLQCVLVGGLTASTHCVEGLGSLSALGSCRGCSQYMCLAALACAESRQCSWPRGTHWQLPPLPNLAVSLQSTRICISEDTFRFLFHHSSWHPVPFAPLRLKCIRSVMLLENT